MKRSVNSMLIKALSILIMLVAVGNVSGSSGYFTHETEGGEEIKFPEIKGWTLIQDYPVYYPESLWDYINGAADAYLSYLFEDLYIAEYKSINGILIKAEVYRHKSPEYAFGIYSIERTPEYDFQQYGTQGYAEESLVHFITGRHYVKVTTNASGNEVQEAVVLIANKVVEMLGDPGSLPPLLQSFPKVGRVSHSEKFISDNFLGHHFMSRVFTVDYSDGDEEFYLFIMDREASDECKKILESYYAFTGQTVELKEGLHTIKDKYNGTISLVWKGNRIWGVMNCDDTELNMKYLKLMEGQ